ncbi:hypothetical protein AALO_G00080340, partial [Alosa alosa]
MALNKLDEILAAAQQTISTNEGPGVRAQGSKRERGRSFYGNEPNYDQSGMGMMSSGAGLGYDRGQFASGHAPPHGVPEEEKSYLHPPGMKFARSLSVPGSDEIPPPPTTAPPDPPFSSAPPLGWRGKTAQQSSAVSVSQSTATSAHYQLYQQSGYTGRDRGGGGPPPDHTAASYAHQAPTRTASRKVIGYPGEVGGVSGAGGAAGMGMGGGKAAGLRRGYSNAVPPTSIATVMPQQQMQASQGQPRGPGDQRGAAGAGGGGGVGAGAGGGGGGGVPKGGARRGKGPLVKQSKVEDMRSAQLAALGGKGSVEKSSIPIPTIIVKAPSTSSSGRSSQGSSVEAEPPQGTSADADGSQPPPGAAPPPPAVTPPAPPSTPAPPPPSMPPALPPSLPSIRAQDSMDFTSQFGAAIVGAARRDRERFHEARRKSASFFLSAEEDVGGAMVGGGVAGGGGGVGAGGRVGASQQHQLGAQPTPRLRPSKSIDEGMFSGDTFIHQARSMPPAFGLPEYSTTATGQMGDYQPKSVPVDFYGAGIRTQQQQLQQQQQQQLQHTTTFIHPLTGKVLDPSSPLGLALAARERALKDDSRMRRDRTAGGGAEHMFTRQLSSVGVYPSASPAASSSTPSHSSGTSSYLVTSSSLAATTTSTRPPSPRILRWGEDGSGSDRERETSGPAGGGGGGSGRHAPWRV